MLEHLNPQSRRPERVVVAGAAGFVGRAVSDCLERHGVKVLRITRRDVDFTSADAHEALAAKLMPNDVFIAVAARAPCKNSDMLHENMAIARTMAKALARVQPSHLVNVSSDAVYADSPEPLTESSCASPDSLHGAMHLAREVIFRNEVAAPLATVRPSLLYGATDPHNGYGPNRFRRLAAEGRDIVLFGQGEERRDHVYIGDVAELVTQIVLRKSRGLLNIATGEVHSFRHLAEAVVRLSGRSVAIKNAPRSGPMPHNGYRPFDIAACREAFPDFRYTPIETGLELAQKE